MTLRRPPAARAAFHCYRGLPRSTRAHLTIRWLTCPMTAIAAEIPQAGRVLDLGCGHGFLSLYLAADGPERTVCGVDVDAAKIAEAKRAAADGGGFEHVSFTEVPADWRPPAEPPWDAIVVNDVLYLLGEPGALALLGAAAAAIAPGGRLVVKEIDTKPWWKYRLAIAQELAATRLAKVTAGDHVAFCSPASIVATMEAAGLTVRERRVDRGYPHPHHLFVGSR